MIVPLVPDTAVPLTVPETVTVNVSLPSVKLSASIGIEKEPVPSLTIVTVPDVDPKSSFSEVTLLTTQLSTVPAGISVVVTVIFALVPSSTSDGPVTLLIAGTCTAVSKPSA